MKTIYWFINNPILLAFLTTYVLLFLCLDLIHIKSSKLQVNKKETLLSIKEFFLIGGIQATLSLALIPVLDIFYPYRLQTLKMNSPIHWIISWIFVDFIYYWIHRFLHHTKIGWSAHAPHHTMTQMTMLDGTRISWGEQPLGVIIYGIPLVIFGVPPHIAGIFYLFIAFYQFIVHTEINWHLGILNKFIFTPVAHRVHHSKLREEADSNFGGFFIIWDKVFGTYKPTSPEFSPHEYGLPSENRPSGLWQVLTIEANRFWADLKNIKCAKKKLLYILAPPK